MESVVFGGINTGSVADNLILFMRMRCLVVLSF